MDRLCDEIIQLILNELDDPTSFSLTSKRLHQFTQDPYVRASYFLSRYGRIEAFYWALGRGKLMNERVIDILLTSGAHLSRYLAQCAIHHYFRTQVPFIKSPWVRTVPLPVFTHFMTVAARMYGDIPITKGDDDGAIFSALLKSSRFPIEQRPGKWDLLKEVLEKYKFIPFCNKDPMMVQFPLVLAIEPRLLPYARANGFNMDRKYRNFVFRKMFEKPAVASEGRTEEIIQNVRELSRLDPEMFLSRTVAAEICMEARTNEAAYLALKRLDKEGVLKFDLATVVEDLIKLFVNTRSVTAAYTYSVIRILYADFPSPDPAVRLVLLLTIFCGETAMPIPGSLNLTVATSAALNTFVTQCKEKVESIGIGPVTKKDLQDILLNKFAPERFTGILEYGREVTKLSKVEVEGLLRDVALGCLEIGCKGKMLKKLVETYDFLSGAVALHLLRNYRLNLDDLPLPEDEKACKDFEAPLCTEFISAKKAYSQFIAEAEAGASGSGSSVNGTMGSGQAEVIMHGVPGGGEGVDDDVDGVDEIVGAEEDLGYIGQDTLTTMIRKDEQAPSRRRRFYDMYTTLHDSMGKLTYPADYIQVGRWIKTHYGARSAVAAVYMIHAVINENVIGVQSSLYSEGCAMHQRVPLTLKHFKMLARIGRAPPYALYDDIEAGTEFFFSEEDYCSPEQLNGIEYITNSSSSSCVARPKVKVKKEHTIKAEAASTPPLSSGSTSKRVPSPRGKKRPRRSAAATVKSYVVPDSDDEEITDEKVLSAVHTDVKNNKRSESNLQRWIKHLTILLKEEQKKYKEYKKRRQAAAPPGTKVRVFKSDFFKSLATNLPRLRKVDQSKRQALYGADVPDEDYSEGEEDEYQHRTTRSKRRKVDADD